MLAFAKGARCAAAVLVVCSPEPERQASGSEGLSDMPEKKMTSARRPTLDHCVLCAAEVGRAVDCTLQLEEVLAQSDTQSVDVSTHCRECPHGFNRYLDR